MKLLIISLLVVAVLVSAQSNRSNGRNSNRGRQQTKGQQNTNRNAPINQGQPSNGNPNQGEGDNEVQKPPSKGGNNQQGNGHGFGGLIWFGDQYGPFQKRAGNKGHKGQDNQEQNGAQENEIPTNNQGRGQNSQRHQ